ncbi:ArnT family glycosyltransferase [Plasticicumulans acidivorans]|uniref:4-amino-4-deoxy-L-arabinose transferase-like glycosyltransferase n=1 Tax=Plasticicumulans acidivorans TaxID=886464 RepID=A0A317MS93_9GAMM|nr:glycosyltransferase family 39 protein [Plasticicumulans acidivorans]PWV58916.1 4-amino-4-deoxy-L-arabinose transferase-like glycosyltransferase [Plasticicumulans acidivorans]
MATVTLKRADARPVWLDLLIVLGALLALHALPLLVHRELWVQDEARYGEVLREMLESGRWLVPHLNGHPYPDKPPLYFWGVAMLGGLVGQGELAFRLFSLLSTLLATLGTWTLGRRLYGARAGLWAALCFLGMLVTVVVGQIARMDMALTAATVWAWVGLLEHARSGSRAALLGFWSGAALALAFKGPIALAFTVVPALLWRAWHGRFAGVRALHPLAGIGGLLLGVLLWIGAVLLDGEGAYLSTIWHEQIVGRAINSWSHKEPFWFYAALLPLLLMPWTLPAGEGLYRAWRERLPGRGLLVGCAGVSLLLISLVSGKLFIYVQPLIPALAVFAGFGCERLLQRGRVETWLVWPPVIYVVLLGLGVAYGTHAQLGDDGAGYAFAVLLLAAAVGGVRLGVQPPLRWLAGWAAIATFVGWVLAAGLIALANPLFSGKPLGEAIARLAPEPRPVALVHSTRGILNYYAGRLLEEVDRQDAAAWHAAHPQGVIVIQSDHLKYLFPDGAIPASCRVHERYEVELKEYRVIADC